MAYGVLVKHEEDYEFFNNAVRDNRLPLENAISSEMNEMFPKHSLDADVTLPPSQIYFNDSSFFSLYFTDYMIIMSALIGLILMFGAAYEMYFHKQKARCCFVEAKPL